MPCYDTQSEGRNTTIYETGISPSQLKEQVRRVEWLEGALCAILTELDKNSMASKIIAEASRNGLVGLMAFWVNHSNNDEARIAKILHGYSKHEQSVMLSLLSK